MTALLALELPICETARMMAEQLRRQHLDVVLAPAPRPAYPGHCVRVAQGCNPDWYRELCTTLTSKRKRARARHDTDVRRARVLRALERLSSGRARYAYDHLVLPYVQAAAVVTA